MTARYTKVPLRRGDRWTSARLAEGQPLVEHEWNLNVDASARALADAVRDVVGSAGVVEGSDAFRVTVSAGPEVTVEPGVMWVGGLEAYAPARTAYSTQELSDPLPAGRALVWLDAFVEHVAPSEMAELVDPALRPVESAARDRVGWRIRVTPTSAATCAAAFAALTEPALSTGTLTLERTAPATPADPCDPPGDPLGLVPEAMLRVEVLDGGTASTARFAWSYENGAASVAATVAGNELTLAPSHAVKFADGDLVEVSVLARRAARRDHGPLYRVVDRRPGAAGEVLVLDRPVTGPTTGVGLVARRWDGETVGATAPVVATAGGRDLGVRFTASGGRYLAGDWWGSRLRSAADPAVEPLSAAPPDGVRHAYAPLALVDLGALTVLSDCRPAFRPLTDLPRGQGVCTVTVFPGEDLQAAVDSLPASGGEVCVAAGTYVLAAPVRLVGRRRVVISGTGPATVLRAIGSEAVLVAERCAEIEVRHLRAEGGSPAGRGEKHRNGALTFLHCTDVRVADCDVACPDGDPRGQTCVTARGGAGRVTVEGNRCEVGTWQTGILVVDAADAVVARNDVHHVRTSDSVPDRRFVPEKAPSRPATREDVSSARSRPRAREDARTSAARGGGLAIPDSAKDDSGRFDETEIGATDKRTRAAILSSFVVGGQGIVVAGSRLGTVRVLDNHVAGVVEGIHVGASHAKVAGRETTDEVVVSRNVVHLTVPRLHDRGRHAVFVGNARSVTVVDTVATLTRPGRPVKDRRFQLSYAVEAIRIYGVLGPYLCVRQSSLDGFSTGVRVTALEPKPPRRARMWLVAETMATGSATAVAAPDTERERNYPLP